MIINCVTHLRSYTNSAIADIAGNSAPISLETPSEIVFHYQSYSSLHSGRSLAWDHFCGNNDDPCGVIVDFCVLSAISVELSPIPEAIGVTDRCVTH